MAGPFDFLVACDTGRPAAQMCCECHAQLATTRITVLRVERGGMLVSERARDACGGCTGAVADSLRATCQWRLYQGRKV